MRVSTFNNLWQWLRCRQLNPVLVKETRQAVRSGAVLAVLALTLVVLTGASLVFLQLRAQGARDVDPASGDNYFGTILLVLVVAEALAAVALFSRSCHELNPGHCDLFRITTLKPGVIVRGKVAAGLTVAALMVSLGLPFLAVSYLLRGISLLTMTAGVTVLIAVGGFLNLLAVMAAALPVPVILRWLALAAGFALFVLLANTPSWADVRFSPRPEDGFILIVLPAVFIPFLLSMYAVSVYLLTPPSANRALPLRLWWTAVALAWIALAILAILTVPTPIPSPTHTGTYPIAAWPFALALYLHPVAWLNETLLVLAAFLFAFQSPDTLPAAVRRRLPRRSLGRMFALVFYETRVSGLLWASLLTVAAEATLFLNYAVLGLYDSDSAYANTTMGELGLYWAVLLGNLLAYALTARWLVEIHRRWFAARSVTSVFVGLTLIGSTIAWLASVFCWESLALGVPMCGSALPWAAGVFGNWQPSSHPMNAYAVVNLTLTLGWLAVMIVINDRWLWAGVRQFFPSENAGQALASQAPAREEALSP